MKKRVLIFSILACFTGMALSSYEHGPAYEGGLNRTGSTGGGANCTGSGCHAANVATTVVAVKITTTAGAPVTSYTPGNTYSVTIIGQNTAAGVSLSEFGFQVSAVLSSTSGQAGTFAVPSGANLRVTPLSGLKIVEHKNALHDSVTNYSVAHFSWTAPAAGSGNVQFYGILNALGEDGEGSGGSGGSGDRKLDDEATGTYPNTAPVVTLTEGNGGSASAVNTVTGIEGVNIYPNPCGSELHIKTTGTCAIRMFAANGIMVYDNVNVSSSVISTEAMPAGVYYVELIQGNKRMVSEVVKK